MLFRMSAIALSLGLSGSVFAQSHAMIDRSRSSLNKNVFLTASVEGEAGTINKTAKGSAVVDSESWRGYGIRNGAGVEVFKFVQFSLSHTLVNMRSSESSLENITGSRVAAEVSFSFSAPITNIQFGLGALADQFQYQAQQQSSTLVGNGHFYSMGLNYFLTPSISFQATGKRLEANNTVSGGSSSLQKMTSKTDNLSLGIAVWL